MGALPLEGLTWFNGLLRWAVVDAVSALSAPASP
jgi:hypothetical protein